MKSAKIFKLLLMFLIFSSCNSKSQSPKNEQDLKNNIIKESKEYAQAYVKMDAEKIVSYFNESFIIDNGGKDSYLNIMRESCKGFKGRNDKIIDVTFSEPDSVIRIGSALFCVLKQTTHESFGITGDKSFEIFNTVIANSNDSGISWRFLGLHGLNEEKIKKYIPGFSYQRFGIVKQE